MQFPRLLSLLVSVLIYSGSFGQDHLIDSITNTFSFYSGDIQHRLDTSLRNFEEYNYVQRTGNEYKNLGNLGSASYPLVLPLNRSIGFRDHFGGFELYRKSWDSMKIYELVSPFAEINYILGLKSESKFSAAHSQKLSKTIDYGTEFTRLNSAGVFKRQSNRHNSFTFYTRFNSRDRKFRTVAKVLMNDIQMQENGGLVEDLFDTTDIINKSILDVNLENAETNIDEFGFGLDNTFSIGFSKDRKINDTLTVKERTETFLISFASSLRRNKYRFRDNATKSEFYAIHGTVPDSLEFNYRNTHLSNTIGMSSTGIIRKNDERKTIPFLFNAGFSHNYHILSQRVEKIFHNLSIEGGISSNVRDRSKIIYQAEAELYFNGRNKGEASIDGRVGYDFGKGGSLESGVFFANQKATYLQERFEHDILWINSFNSISNLQADVLYRNEEFRMNVSATYLNINNFIYQSTEGTPNQLNSALSGFIIKINKGFKLGKNFNLDNSITFQSYSEEEEVISKPSIIGKHSIYFAGPLFKKAVSAIIGFDLRIQSEYFPQAYFPYGTYFYNQTEVKQEPYPSIDAFVNMQVGSLRVFFKVNNLSQGLFQDGYYSSIYYPFDERSFRFGLNWRFFD